MPLVWNTWVLHMYSAGGGQSISGNARLRLRSVADTLLAAFRSSTPRKEGGPAAGVANPPVCPREPGLEGRFGYWISQPRTRSVKPPQQLLGKKVMGKEGEGVYTRTRVCTQSLSLWASPGNVTLSAHPHLSSGPTGSCSCLPLATVSRTYGRKYLGALEKVAHASPEAELADTLLWAASGAAAHCIHPSSHGT